MRFITTGAIALLILFSAGCHGVVKAPAASPASVEQQIYADLLTAQTAIEGLKSQPTIAAPIKAQLNQAIVTYNLAEKAFTDYEVGKGANLASSTDLIKLQAMILDLKTQISTVGQAFGKESK